MKVLVTDEGLLIPGELAERLGSNEVEVIEEPGRLVVVAGAVDARRRRHTGADDPMWKLGRNPVRTGARDGSTHHDTHLYDGNA